MLPLPRLISIRARATSLAVTLAKSVRSHWLGLVAASLALLVYGICRHYEGYGCDPWSYLAGARILRGQDVGLNGTLDPQQFPAVVPLCCELVGRNLVPGMPPGYSLEVAMGGLFHLEGM